MDDRHWNNLIRFITEGRVIPIVGPELLVWEGEAAGSLHERLATRLVQSKPGAATAPAKPPCAGRDALNYGICRYMKDHDCGRQEVDSVIEDMIREMQLATPEPLKKLASIGHFKLFITTTFDNLLERAINEVRFGGAGKTTSLEYAPNRWNTDLPSTIRELQNPMVYHLLGKLSLSEQYVGTDEDMLVFFNAMLEKRRPELLFDELKKHHLLLIGTRFPDWLARFFIRLAKGSDRSVQLNEYVADTDAPPEGSLVLFLQNFSRNTRVFPGGAVEFVNELTRRYLAHHPPSVLIPADPQPSTIERSPGNDAEMSSGAVFLSYAHEDRMAVKQLMQTLENARIEVWYDENKLNPGARFDSKIAENIRRCSIFIPVVSATTQKVDGYYRREWAQAADWSLERAYEFIIPVCVDQMNIQDAIVPDAFRKVSWAFAPGGRVDSEFTKNVKQLSRQNQLRVRGMS